MTVKEAIEILKRLRDDLDMKSKYVDCFDTAISALEKQEGKKPVEVYPDGKPGVGYFCCPNCNRRLLRRNECVYCGQRIDWSGEHGTD